MPLKERKYPQEEKSRVEQLLFTECFHFGAHFFSVTGDHHVTCDYEVCECVCVISFLLFYFSLLSANIPLKRLAFSFCKAVLFI